MARFLDAGSCGYNAAGSGWAMGVGLAACLFNPFNFREMALITALTHSPALLDILHDDKVRIGQAVREESGFWVFYPNDKPWYYEAHKLIHIAALLDRLNAPYSAEVAAFFDNLPKEISQDVQDDSFPF